MMSWMVQIGRRGGNMKTRVVSPSELDPTKKVGDLTVGELFELLDVTEDLVARQRTIEKQITEKLEQAFQNYEITNACSPIQFSTANEFSEWSDITKLKLAYEGTGYNLVVLYAWVRA